MSMAQTFYERGCKCPDACEYHPKDVSIPLPVLAEALRLLRNYRKGIISNTDFEELARTIMELAKVVEPPAAGKGGGE